MTGFVVVNYKDESIRQNNFFLVPKDEYNRNKNKYIAALTSKNYGKAVYKNKNNPADIRKLNVDDPLVLSGEFIGVLRGIKQSKEIVLKKTGEKNGSFNSFWITNGIENKRIKDMEIPEGWRKGRTMIGYRKYKNINTGEEGLFPINEVPNNFIPSSFFNELGNIITNDEIYKKYEELGSWNKVSKFFKKDRKLIKEILSFYSDKIT